MFRLKPLEENLGISGNLEILFTKCPAATLLQNINLALHIYIYIYIYIYIMYIKLLRRNKKIQQF